jgi:UDP-N-acetylmuramoylalanine--D-glutamate ligase
MTFENLASENRTSLQQTMAANLQSRIFNARNKALKSRLNTEEENSHSMEEVATVKGVRYVNDSKAVNINTTWFSLESIDSPVIWIVGAKDSKNDYSTVLDVVERKVKIIICLCREKNEVPEFFQDKGKLLIHATTMEEAVQSANFLSKSGDTVLFSPARASFDMYPNFFERGDDFKRMVKNL